MELILKENIDNLGFKDDIVTVKNGYGRNYLIPNGKAVLATESVKKVLAETLKQRAYKEQKNIDDANIIAEALKSLEIKILAKTADSNKLFGSISNDDVVKAIEKLGQQVDKKFVKLSGGTIKRLGKYTATIRLHRSVIIEMPFEIVNE